MIQTLQVEVEFKNVRSIRLTVYPPDGRVKVCAPLNTDQESIRRFAASKIKWIEKHRQKFMNHSKLTGPPKNNSSVYVWGAALKLEIVARNGHPKIVIADQGMTMYVRPDSTEATRQEFLDKWYRSSLKDAASPIIKVWEKRMGVQVKKLFVRKMKSHWGSCNCEKQTLRLNSELAKRGTEYLEYVIVHEMLHIIEKSHNRRFYRLLEQYLPDWKNIRKKINAGEISYGE